MIGEIHVSPHDAELLLKLVAAAVLFLAFAIFLVAGVILDSHLKEKRRGRQQLEEVGWAARHGRSRIHDTVQEAFHRMTEHAEERRR